MIILSDASTEALTKAVPLSYEDVSHRIDELGPFERSPHIAVAVSGGRDSIGLCLLVNEWAQKCDGWVSAITVDHQLRPESAEEAKQVGDWLVGFNIDHHVLVWEGSKPSSGTQAAARKARYDLMEEWCRRAGVLHLFLGHHQDDQAETVLFRLQHDSGIDGLAGMSAVRERSHIRLLRPLLDIPRENVTAYLQDQNQAWIEDPSNKNPKYARTVLRNSLESADEGELTIEQLTTLSNRCARARIVLEEDAARVMAQCCRVYPEGYVQLDVAKFRTVPAEISLRVLSRAIRCIGGRGYGPKQAQLERVHGLIQEGRFRRSRTLGGCQISYRDGVLLVFREYRNLPALVEMTAGQPILWDNRFRVALDDRVFQACDRVWLGAFGRKGRQEIKELQEFKTLSGASADEMLPAAVRQTLPALRDRHGLAFVPHLNFTREDLVAVPQNARNAAFQPRQSLGERGFVGLMLHKQRDILSL